MDLLEGLIVRLPLKLLALLTPATDQDDAGGERPQRLQEPLGDADSATRRTHHSAPARNPDEDLHRVDGKRQDLVEKREVEKGCAVVPPLA